ncbi:hypothetical protein [Streptomyces sp. NBRC 109706]|uniref:hypothetical protein n=1 Tax=Streptomyces sp. NBRC 109706 TaxID=1550035 RepID=UPI0007840008|nr:hypothetical protein [Streptomyces sp. NBRC 109706]
MYNLHKLLWDIRKDPDLARRFLADPDAVLDSYGITGANRAAMRDLDFRAMYERGFNPYLIYFCAIQLKVDRAEYYARIRGEEVR